jgi:hypothetical protein
MFKYLLKIARLIKDANFRAGATILASGWSGMFRIAPSFGWRRRMLMFARYSSKLNRGAAHALIPGLAIPSVGYLAWRVLRKNEVSGPMHMDESLFAESVGADPKDLVFFDRSILNSGLSALQSVANLSSRHTDMEALVACIKMNKQIIALYEGVLDPKVATYATKHLLYSLALYRAGLAYEFVNSELETQHFFSLFESGAANQDNHEDLVLIDAALTANTRFYDDLYGS